MSPKLSVIALSIVPPVALLSRVYGRYVQNITKQVQDSLADATQVNLRDIKTRIEQISTLSVFVPLFCATCKLSLICSCCPRFSVALISLSDMRCTLFDCETSPSIDGLRSRAASLFLDLSAGTIYLRRFALLL